MPRSVDPARVENLEGLLQQIRQEGADRARREAEAILAAARQQAADMVSQAANEAKRMVEEAEARATQTAAVARVAREQAARDLALAVRSQLIAMLDRLIEQACREALSGPALQELIRKSCAAWLAATAARHIEIHINEQERALLSDVFLDQLRAELKVGVELKLVPGLPGGFRVGRRAGAMFYDFTVPAVAGALAARLRPEFAQSFDPLRKEG